jgi:hypothetical protein
MTVTQKLRQSGQEISLERKCGDARYKKSGYVRLERSFFLQRYLSTENQQSILKRVV